MLAHIYMDSGGWKKKSAGWNYFVDWMDIFRMVAARKV